MPHSNRSNEEFVKQYIYAKVKPDGAILDVGPGAGMNYDMLADRYSNIDGVEVFEPYVERYGLRNRYRNIFIENVVDFNKFSNYDLVIMGDVLEHLTVSDSVKVLENIIESGSHALIQVPYQYEQGMIEGNVYEIHIQDDLTEEMMNERYGRYLTRICLTGFMAVYVTK